MSLVKKLLGGAIVSTILGIIFAGLLINAHFCLTKPDIEDNAKSLFSCQVARIVYFVLLGMSIAVSLSLSIASWIVVHRRTHRPANGQSQAVRYNALTSPEEEDQAVQIRVPETRRGSVEEPQPGPNPYSAFPPAAMYSH